MPVRLTARYPTGTAITPATSAPNSTATGNGTGVCSASSPAAYPAVPQKAAWPNDSSPVYPTSRSSATASNAQAAMSSATGGYTSHGSATATASPTARSSARFMSEPPGSLREALWCAVFPRRFARQSRRRRASLHSRTGLLPAEQAGRAPQQHRGHEHEHQRLRQRRQVKVAQRGGDADAEAGQHRTGDRAQPADDDDCEHGDDQIGTHQ